MPTHYSTTGGLLPDTTPPEINQMVNATVTNSGGNGVPGNSAIQRSGEPPSNIGPTTPIDPGDGPIVGLHPGPRVELTQQLIGSGYDPTRADEIAQMLLANASSTPGARMPSVPGINAGTATAVQAAAPSPVEQQTYEGLLGYGTGIGIGNTEVSTREVQDNELVANQLEGLLSGDSSYIRNARLRAAELASARGQFGSSFMAGAAERAAIEAGLPIATADAQAYRDAATQNLNALNNFALANLQRATSIDTALLDANTNISLANMDAATRVTLANLDALTRISIANLDADTQAKIANLSSQTNLAVQQSQNELSLIMQSREMTHQTGIEQLRQQGNMDLAMVDADLRMRLERFAQDGRIDLQNLSHEQQLIVNEEIARHNAEREAQNNSYTRRENQASLAAQAQQNYINYVAAYANSDMDANAAARLRAEAWNHLLAELDMINGLYSEFPPITARERGV